MAVKDDLFYAVELLLWKGVFGLSSEGSAFRHHSGSEYCLSG